MALLALVERARGLGGVRPRRPAPLGRAADPRRRDLGDRRRLPRAAAAGRCRLKFLIPGTVFLLAFQIVPIIYTISIAFSNYSTGHVITKADAIEAIKVNSLQPPENGRQFEIAPAHDSGGKLVLILHDDASGAVFEGTNKGLTPLPKADVTISTETGQPTAAKGFTLIKGAELFALDAQLKAFNIPTTATRRSRARASARPSSCSRRSATTRRRTSSCGSATASSSRTTAGARSSRRRTRRTSSSPAGRRSPASTTSASSSTTRSTGRRSSRSSSGRSSTRRSSCFASFALGLFLAITLDKKGMRFQRFYRSALIIPWAMPGFLSLLIWAGLLNDDFGVDQQAVRHPRAVAVRRQLGARLGA